MLGLSQVLPRRITRTAIHQTNNIGLFGIKLKVTSSAPTNSTNLCARSDSSGNWLRSIAVLSKFTLTNAKVCKFRKTIPNEKIVDKKFAPPIYQRDKYKLVIDPMSEMLLMGTTIDYIKEDYSKQIFESKFTFTPEKEIASTCGCGVSFSPK